jgi:hypothetical protein
VCHYLISLFGLICHAVILTTARAFAVMTFSVRAAMIAWSVVYFPFDYIGFNSIRLAVWAFGVLGIVAVDFPGRGIKEISGSRQFHIPSVMFLREFLRPYMLAIQTLEDYARRTIGLFFWIVVGVEVIRDCHFGNSFFMYVSILS